MRLEDPAGQCLSPAPAGVGIGAASVSEEVSSPSVQGIGRKSYP